MGLRTRLETKIRRKVPDSVWQMLEARSRDYGYEDVTEGLEYLERDARDLLATHDAAVRRPTRARPKRLQNDAVRLLSPVEKLRGDVLRRCFVAEARRDPALQD